MRGNTRPVILGLTGLAAAAVSGCAQQADAVGICTDPQTHKRIDDSYCQHGHHDYDDGGSGSPFLWYYLGTQSGHSIPAVGERYSGGTYHASRYSYPARGGVTTKGASSVKSFVKSPAGKSFTKSSGFGSSHGTSSS